MISSKRIYIVLVFSLTTLLLGQDACRDESADNCNTTQDCPRLSFCINGECQRVTCESDSDCAPTAELTGCDNGLCVEVECNTAEDCPRGDKACINHRCQDCENSSQCNEFSACIDNECVGVECKNPGQCAIDETCSPSFECVDLCGEDEVFVSRQDGDRLCKACVNPQTAKRCNEFPGCFEDQGKFCAQGFCISRCNLDPPDLDSWLDLEGFKRIPIQPDPGGTPGIDFGMIGVRGVLERAGVTESVRLRLLDNSGQLVAELGNFSPNKGSWATIPELIQPELKKEISKEGGCGYNLEFATGTDQKTAQAAVCLEPRKKSIP